ncbi:MAG: hypothetical protein ABW072_17285 [Sedimenticola sp.]
MTSTIRPIENRTDPKAIEIVRRREYAVDMRVRGCSFRQIGEALGITTQAAGKLVRRQLDRHISQTQDKVERMRELDAARLDTLLLAVWEKAESGDLKAGSMALKILERRAKLFGLDAPVKLEPIEVPCELPYAPIDDAERVARLSAILDAARERMLAEKKIIDVQADLKDKQI